MGRLGKRGELIERALGKDAQGQVADIAKQASRVTIIEEYDRVSQPCHHLGLGVRVCRRDAEGHISDGEVVGVVRRRHSGEVVVVRHVLLVFPW